MRLLVDHRRLIPIALALALSACGGGGSTPEAANGLSADGVKAMAASAGTTKSVSGLALADVKLQVTQITFVSETRITRTVFDYRYKVQLTNQGVAVEGAAATLKTAGAGTTIVNGAASFTAIAAGASASSTNDIVIRQDRTFPFNPSALVWEVNGTASPPPPPPPPDVAGSDANGDGVRDDVAAYIETNYGGQPPVKKALMQLAGGLQASATAADDTQRSAADAQRFDAGRCLYSVAGGATQASKLAGEVKARQLDTEARIRAELRFSAWLAGKLVTLPSTTAAGACK
jgi:hypothetical protein